MAKARPDRRTQGHPPPAAFELAPGPKISENRHALASRGHEIAMPQVRTWLSVFRRRAGRDVCRFDHRADGATEDRRRPATGKLAVRRRAPRGESDRLGVFAGSAARRCQATQHGVVKLWNVADGRLIRTIRAIAQQVTFVAFTAGRKAPASRSPARSEPGTARPAVPFTRSRNPPASAPCLPSRTTGCGSSPEATTRPPANGTSRPAARSKTTCTNSAAARSALSPSRRIAGWSRRPTMPDSVLVWNTESGELVRTVKGDDQTIVAARPLAGWPSACCPTPSAGAVNVWEVETGRPIRIQTHAGETSRDRVLDRLEARAGLLR